MLELASSFIPTLARARGTEWTPLNAALVACHKFHGDHLSGKPGNVKEFDSFHGNVSDFTICQ